MPGKISGNFDQRPSQALKLAKSADYDLTLR
jgi:hypothetical protein